jgi:nucleotide-binding universal stress UspA family protein
VAVSQLPSTSTRTDLVVGFDGSDPAGRALAWALRILSTRPGTLHVVYVNQGHAAAGFAGLGMAETLEAEDEVAADLHKQVDEMLGRSTLTWSYERRDGGVVDQLVAVVEERRASAPEGTDTVVVVGRSAHAVHKVVGSVPVGLLHRSPAPVVTIP